MNANHYYIRNGVCWIQLMEQCNGIISLFKSLQSVLADQNPFIRPLIHFLLKLIILNAHNNIATTAVAIIDNYISNYSICVW